MTQSDKPDRSSKWTSRLHLPPGLRSRRVHCTTTGLPAPLLKLVHSVYRHFGRLTTYALLLVIFGAAVFTFMPSLVMLPSCRRVLTPEELVAVQETDSTAPATTAHGLGSESREAASAASAPGDPGSIVYQPGLECYQGEILTVVIYYGTGFLVGELMELIRLPGLLGMLIAGIALRNIGNAIAPVPVYHVGYTPNGTLNVLPNQSRLTFTELLVGNLSTPPGSGDDLFNVLDLKSRVGALLQLTPSLSTALRQVALATILIRAGLGIDPTVLKNVIGGVLRLSLVPCFCEALCLMLVTRFTIGWPWAWGAVLGFVVAAVSPAVVAVNMMQLEAVGLGVAQGIPTLLVAACSIDDVGAITGFGVALSLALSRGANIAVTLLLGPVEAVAGVAFGGIMGIILCVLPPPKMEHSHLIRGIILVFTAVTGLVGSVSLHLPGAGALSALTLAFVVATGWRCGYPWRLVKSSSSKETCLETDIPSILAVDGLSSQGQSRRPSSNSATEPGTSSNGRMTDGSLEMSLAGRLEETSIGFTGSGGGAGRKTPSSQKGQLSGFLRVSSVRYHKKPSTRRLSLPEPTAYYESDLVSPVNKAWWVNKELSPGASVIKVNELQSQHHNIVELEEIDEEVEGAETEVEDSGIGKEDSPDGETKPGTLKEDTVTLSLHHEAARHDLSTGIALNQLLVVAITPEERGAACLKSMKTAMAAIWWFVQPVLFSLIGSEINLTNLAGVNVGLGVLSLLIGVVVRSVATFAVVLPNKMNMKERLFVAFSWIPKATVQAAVGPVALDTARQLNASPEFINYGKQVLTLAALAIILTAPLGALLMPYTAPFLLRRDPKFAQGKESKIVEDLEKAPGDKEVKYKRLRRFRLKRTKKSAQTETP